MPRRKMRGGRTLGSIKPATFTNALIRPTAQAPQSTWEKIKNFAKQHKLVSRGLSALGGIVPAEYKGVKGAFDAGSAFASSYGYGRRRKRQIGGSSKVIRY
jgi:hypothetical protein